MFFLQHVEERLVLLYRFSGFKTNFAALWVELFNTLLFPLVFAHRSGRVFAWVFLRGFLTEPDPEKGRETL